MSQLVRLEGKHTWQNAHCALLVVKVVINMSYGTVQDRPGLIDRKMKREIMENSKFNQGTVQGRPGLNSLGRRTPPNSHKTNAFIGERIFQSQCLSDHNKNEEVFSSFTTQIKATPCSQLKKKFLVSGRRRVRWLSFPISRSKMKNRANSFTKLTEKVGRIKRRIIPT